MTTKNTINYIEFHARDLEATKQFFGSVFGWTFEDFGPDYSSFSNQGVDGGFFRSEHASCSDTGAALIVLYTDEIENLERQIVSAGGTITKPIFSFPGGRRFHFTEPSGNELAVWTEPAED
ncbi:VOC family protein [Congregibacter brevis]|uniref:VOC family protein n=1 Tax=Congregibacter brevis TaxID=3081201 RepID=A0ABZ0I8R5_9GAMM|nr:VOC family protein [Congregibacter sp. IMCC45268]